MTTVFDVVLKGVAATNKELDRQALNNVRSLNSAFRIEGFRLKKLLQTQIRSGAPGGSPFAERRIISRYWRRSKPGRKKALGRLANGIRYYVPNTIEPRLQIGFVGPTNAAEREEMNSGLALGRSGNTRGIKYKDMTSKAWRRLGLIHQKGFRMYITPDMREALKDSAKLAPKKIKPFFYGILNSNRTHFNTPSRNIIEPFWTQQKSAAIYNIRNNYHKIMAGLVVK